MYIVQHIRAENDVNGNPQRCFVLYHAGYVNENPEHGGYVNVIAVEDEGYSGEPKEWKNYPHLYPIDVSIHEYKFFMSLP